MHPYFTRSSHPKSTENPFQAPKACQKTPTQNPTHIGQCQNLVSHILLQPEKRRLFVRIRVLPQQQRIKTNKYSIGLDYFAFAPSTSSSSEVVRVLESFILLNDFFPIYILVVFVESYPCMPVGNVLQAIGSLPHV